MAFEVFKSFYHEEEALGMLDLLKEKGIDCKLEKTKVIVDKVIIGDGMEPSIHLKMKPGDFSRAHKVIDEEARENISALDPDYYLFSFSDKELFEIINKPDEWSEQDVVIAQKILADRGYSLSDREIDTIKSNRIKELASSENIGRSWIILGYVFAFVFAPVALFLGHFLLTGKKLLPDGNNVLIYDEKTRNHGVRIILLAGVVLILALFLVLTKWNA